MDRITTRVGDMLRDQLGQSYNLILVSAICHMFSPDENRKLRHRIYDALAPRGQVVVQDFIIEPTRRPRRGSLHTRPQYWCKHTFGEFVIMVTEISL